MCVCERHTTSTVFHVHVVVYALVNTIFRVVFFSVMVEHCLRTITSLLHPLNPHPQFVYMRLVCVQKHYTHTSCSCCRFVYNTLHPYFMFMLPVCIQHVTPIFHVHAAGLCTTRYTHLFMFMLPVCVQHITPIFHVHAAGLCTTHYTHIFMFMLLVCVQHVTPIFLCS